LILISYYLLLVFIWRDKIICDIVYILSIIMIKYPIVIVIAIVLIGIELLGYLILK